MLQLPPSGQRSTSPRTFCEIAQTNKQISAESETRTARAIIGKWPTVEQAENVQLTWVNLGINVSKHLPHLEASSNANRQRKSLSQIRWTRLIQFQTMLRYRAELRKKPVCTKFKSRSSRKGPLLVGHKSFVSLTNKRRTFVFSTTHKNLRSHSQLLNFL